jgi:hypothetical protein
MLITEYVIEAAARAAHEVNRAYCIALGDGSQPPWDEAPHWQKQSARSGVVLALSGATPAESHQSRLSEKERDGWVYGPVKDPTIKQHPCMVPYDQLPEAQRAKDTLYLSTVRAISTALGVYP